MSGTAGEWLILTVMLPYFVATGLQDTYLRLGLLIASALAGAHIVLLGVVGYLARQRKVFPYILEVVFVIMYPILCGVAYADEHSRSIIQKYYNFIVLSTLAGTSLLSLMVTYPLGLAHIQEQVPWHMSSHEEVLRLGYQTTSLFCAATTSLCLLYIWPVARGVEDQHMHILNLIFRLILPEVVIAIVVVLMKFWPQLQVQYLWHRVNEYNKEAQAKGMYEIPLGKPRILDNAMYAPPTKPAINPYEIPQQAPPGHLAYQTTSMNSLSASPYSTLQAPLSKTPPQAAQQLPPIQPYGMGPQYLTNQPSSLFSTAASLGNAPAPAPGPAYAAPVAVPAAPQSAYGAAGLQAGPGVSAAPAPLLPAGAAPAGAVPWAGQPPLGYYPAAPDNGVAWLHKLANKNNAVAPSAPTATGYLSAAGTVAYPAAPGYSQPLAAGSTPGGYVPAPQAPGAVPQKPGLMPAGGAAYSGQGYPPLQTPAAAGYGQGYPPQVPPAAAGYGQGALQQPQAIGSQQSGSPTSMDSSGRFSIPAHYPPPPRQY